MYTKREWIIFFAGAEVFHTLTHLFFFFSGSLPLRFFDIIFTQSLNTGAIIINAIAAIGLLYWAQKTR